jgi:hypothetical protein
MTADISDNILACALVAIVIPVVPWDYVWWKYMAEKGPRRVNAGGESFTQPHEAFHRQTRAQWRARTSGKMPIVAGRELVSWSTCLHRC